MPEHSAECIPADFQYDNDTFAIIGSLSSWEQLSTATNYYNMEHSSDIRGCSHPHKIRANAMLEQKKTALQC